MTNKKSNKNISKTVIGTIIGLTTFFIIKQFIFTPPTIDEAMMHAASEINKSCPIMVDQETRLDNAISLPDNIFQYNYTLINIVKDSIDLKTFEDYMQPMIINNVKTNPDLKICRENKVTMAYSYKDMKGEFITKISISPDKYSDSE